MTITNDPTVKPFKRPKMDKRAKTARRLIKLADLLDTVPPHQFDMSSWMYQVHPDGHSSAPDGLDSMVDFTKGFDCGTSACVAGWALWLWRDEITPREETIGTQALKILGLDHFGDWSESGHEDLFEASAAWDTPDKAANECRRRAIRILEDLNGVNE